MNDLTEQFWDDLKRDHPSFDRADDTNITLSTRGLKKLIDKAIEEGYSAGVIASHKKPMPKQSYDMPDFMKGFFNRK